MCVIAQNLRLVEILWGVPVDIQDAEMVRDINLLPVRLLMSDGKRKMKSNTEDEYKKVLASDDPTKISKDAQEKLTREAIKKFKTLS